MVQRRLFEDLGAPVEESITFLFVEGVDHEAFPHDRYLLRLQQAFAVRDEELEKLESLSNFIEVRDAVDVACDHLVEEVPRLCLLLFRLLVSMQLGRRWLLVARCQLGLRRSFRFLVHAQIGHRERVFSSSLLRRQRYFRFLELFLDLALGREEYFGLVRLSLSLGALFLLTFGKLFVVVVERGLRLQVFLLLFLGSKLVEDQSQRSALELDVGAQTLVRQAVLLLQLCDHALP